jgi:hypothetical protein
MPSVAVIKTFTKSISVTDAAERLFSAASAAPRTQLIKMHALAANSTPVYFGDSTVKASTFNGDVLAANARDSIAMESLISTEAIFVSGTAGDKVSVVYMEQF